MIIEKQIHSLAWLIIEHFAHKEGGQLKQRYPYEEVLLLEDYVVTLNLN